MTFRHAGDIGDIIAFLPTMRALGGGELLIEAATYTRQQLTPDKWCGVDLLIKQQPYVTDVRPWSREFANFNGNDFRARMHQFMGRGMFKDKSLCDWMLEAHGVPLAARDSAWLSVEPKKVARVVFNRTGPGRDGRFVYHNHLFPWHRIWQKYGKDAVFIGSELEHQVFCATCGEVPHFKTANLLEAAQVINGADLFVGNQSVCFWIAEGLKKPLILEVWPQGPNSNIFRPNAIQGTAPNFPLPDL